MVCNKVDIVIKDEYRKNLNENIHSRKNDDDYEITILIIAYNTIYEKIIHTIDSILVQEGVNYQIVITDDGSSENFFKELDEFFQYRGFSDYKLTALPENMGTIANLKNGFRFSTGKYVKVLAPGDEIYGKRSLRKWLDVLEKSSSKWSFCDIVCYHKENGVEQVDETIRHPLNLKPYTSNNEFSCRLNYLLFGDNVNGACILSERDFMEKYLDKLEAKIKYAEDNLWRLCMYDGFVPVYCNKIFVKYEFGTGISTSGNQKWYSIIRDEWITSTKIMLNEKPRDFAQYILRGALFLEQLCGLKYLRALWRKSKKVLLGKKAYTVNKYPESDLYD